MNEYVEKLMSGGLVWFPEKGLGYYPVKKTHYDDQYFNEYVRMEHTDMGGKLNKFRAALVNKYTKDLVLDVGIGCGTFMKRRGNCIGFDVCPKAIYQLKRTEQFFNPYNGAGAWKDIKGITFFDSLEHMEWPELIFSNITDQFVFVSIPIFRDAEHVVGSKHFKKEEHFLYFTDQGFINYMKSYGFEPLEKRDDEIRCGREDIYTYVFQRGSE